MKIEKYLKKDAEYYNIVEKIINHPEFIRRKEFRHHGNRTVYDHKQFYCHDDEILFF